MQFNIIEIKELDKGNAELIIDMRADDLIEDVRKLKGKL